ncbi:MULTISPECIES: o-succinylbenzoate synthase [unclassified Rothia (in: high G+C Gram-positive bacteria)]|uniref:o-succinylbenzoate synthase n=1 Tax=unclassified Rothia (in: high G+C Gram-positive bacteria) TaxID=2689056 RepID=UPI00195A0E3D|nr:MULTISPECIES: o-succinylbenzoate synthase [unclassified Rothia (in: high G+C Gram-positive bacteria)]MBM7051921.1 o-succinylbenzoate synthase [Rothia sp. ZJ1223]QRZ62004.1 o-succinylbenzoate synthase [Rothia sp. ZJ932]
MEHSLVAPLPALTDVLEQVHVVSLPLRVKFRGVLERETLLLKGAAGWGEFAPFLEYEDAEASAWLASALESAWQGYPKPLRSSIALNATVPAVSADQVESVLARYEGEVREVKIKVAEPLQTLADDLARVAAVRELLPQAGIKIDANMGWSHSQAIEALTRLEPFDLLYAEQPVASIEGLARVRQELNDKGHKVLIAADESVRKAQDPLLVAQAGAADVLIIKAAPLGGVRRALSIVEASGLPCVVSSALESSVGIATGAALAAALPELPFGCGLGTVSLMGADVTSEPLVAKNGELPVRAVEPETDLLRRHAVSPERRHWWIERLRRCYEYLEEAHPTS